MNDWVLVIDQGGQSTRVAVFDPTGNIVAQDKFSCATQILELDDNQQHIEQNPQEILQGLFHSLEKIQQQLGDDLKNIKSAGFSGQGSSLVCWDNQTGEALSPILSWQDTRGKGYLENINLTDQQVQQTTGLRLSPHYGASKFRWCLDQLDSVKQAKEKGRLSVGPIFSFLLWHLAGKENYIDPGHAQRTLLWNLHSATWDKQLLNKFSIPEEILPNCLYHQDNFGSLLLDHHPINFRVSARDQGASLFANGFPQADICYVNIGTGAFIQSVTQELLAPDGLLVSPLWLTEDEKWFAWEATVNGAAAAIPFMEKQTGLQITPEVMDQALSVQLGTHDYFINTQGGIGAPFWRTDLPSHFSSELPALHQVAAWLESITFLLRVNLESMNRNNRLTSIQLSGGFSRSDKFCQRLADVLELPVHTYENAEASLQGIAFLTASCPATWKIKQADQTFIANNNPLLHQRYNHWYKALRLLLDK
jgi:glycerol kinase